MLPLLKKLLEADFPGIEVLADRRLPQGNAVIGSEETAALVKAERRRRGASSATRPEGPAPLHAAGRPPGSKHEGIPTVTLTREDFVGVMTNAVAGLGLAPDAAMVTFPIALFLPGSDISPSRRASGSSTTASRGGARPSPATARASRR